MSNGSRDSFPDFHEAHLHWAPEIYELENLAADPEGHVEATMASLATWKDKIVLDIGAGTGFHLPRFSQEARQVIAVEPHGPSRRRALARVAQFALERVSVVAGSAEHLPLPNASVDICHARLAYFFAPNCQAGLAEVARVIRPGGTAFLLDVDGHHGTFGSWLRRHPAWPNIEEGVLDHFWRVRGFRRRLIASEWRFQYRADLEAVIRLEFGPTLATHLLKEHTGTSLDYYYNLHYRHYSSTPEGG